MGTMASQITSLTIAYSTVIQAQIKENIKPPCLSLGFVWGIIRPPVNSLHKWPVTREILSFDDVIMILGQDNFCAAFRQADNLDIGT